MILFDFQTEGMPSVKIPEVLNKGEMVLIDEGIGYAEDYYCSVNDDGTHGKVCGTVVRILLSREVFVEAYNKYIKSEVDSNEK